jgi:hypothetical protein
MLCFRSTQFALFILTAALIPSGLKNIFGAEPIPVSVAEVGADVSFQANNGFPADCDGFPGLCDFRKSSWIASGATISSYPFPAKQYAPVAFAPGLGSMSAWVPSAELPTVAGDPDDAGLTDL